MIDLRSDTVTRPSAAMRDAMHVAPVGDDVWGDDPSVARFEDAVAERAGKAAALLFPSGTQSNLAALLAHCQRGDEYLAGDHRRAARLAEGIRALPDLEVAYQATNMVFLRIPEPHVAPLRAWLAERGILVELLYATRLVVHRDLDDDAIERVLEALGEYFTRH